MAEKLIGFLMTLFCCCSMGNQVEIKQSISISEENILMQMYVDTGEIDQSSSCCPRSPSEGSYLVKLYKCGIYKITYGGCNGCAACKENRSKCTPYTVEKTAELSKKNMNEIKITINKILNDITNVVPLTVSTDTWRFIIYVNGKHYWRCITDVPYSDIVLDLGKKLIKLSPLKFDLFELV